MRSKATIAALSMAAFISFPTASQQSPAQNPAARARAEVLVLGVYHMNNPGRDVFNTEADDVLAPKRQAEIAQVIVALERFRPTKIAVEAGFNGL